VVVPTRLVPVIGNASAETPGTATATCPVDTTLTGGGVSVDDNLLPVITSVKSAPDGANGWTATVRTLSTTDVPFTVYAICLPLTPDETLETPQRG
jgi:hypothetical protein